MPAAPMDKAHVIEYHAARYNITPPHIMHSWLLDSLGRRLLLAAALIALMLGVFAWTGAAL